MRVREREGEREGERERGREGERGGEKKCCLFALLTLLFHGFVALQIILLAIGRYFVGCIFTYREMELMDNLIPAQLYPKCARKMKSGEGKVVQDTMTLKSLTATNKAEESGNKHQEAMGNSDIEVVVTQYETPDLARHGVGGSDRPRQESTV